MARTDGDAIALALGARPLLKIETLKIWIGMDY